MALVADISALRDRVLADLDAAHDYYTDTKLAWDLVRQVVAAGQTFSIRNTTTNTVTTHTDLATKARGYVAEQLAEATFQQFLSIFENYLFDLLRLWLQAYPQSLIGKQVDVRAVLEAPDKAAVISQVVQRELTDVFYDRPAGWFEYLEKRARLGCPTPDEVNRIAEAKATRDVFVHNRGVANALYRSKAGPLARYEDGQRVDIPEQYHRDTWELIRKVVGDISNAAIVKVT